MASTSSFTCATRHASSSFSTWCLYSSLRRGCGPSARAGSASDATASTASSPERTEIRPEQSEISPEQSEIRPAPPRNRRDWRTRRAMAVPDTSPVRHVESKESRVKLRTERYQFTNGFEPDKLPNPQNARYSGAYNTETACCHGRRPNRDHRFLFRIDDREGNRQSRNVSCRSCRSASTQRLADRSASRAVFEEIQGAWTRFRYRATAPFASAHCALDDTQRAQRSFTIASEFAVQVLPRDSHSSPRFQVFHPPRHLLVPASIDRLVRRPQTCR